jgi:hypothetical protein
MVTLRNFECASDKFYVDEVRNKVICSNSTTSTAAAAATTNNNSKI